MANTSDIRNGLYIKHNKNLWKIVEFQHVKPGKGPAFVRTKIKSLSTGKVLDHTIPAGHKIEVVRIENRKHQFLYNDDTGFHFMDTSDYNQVLLEKNLINTPELLKEGQEVEIIFHAEEEMPLSCDLPPNVVLKVIHTEPGLKGNTATNATKSATVETGAQLQVPLFIEEGNHIKIDTMKGTYSERVN